MAWLPYQNVGKYKTEKTVKVENDISVNSFRPQNSSCFKEICKKIFKNYRTNFNRKQDKS